MKRALFFGMLIMLAGCTASDKEIRADIAGKAQQDMNFSGLSFSVLNGVVEVTGKCPSGKAFQTVKRTLTNIHVIKAIHYNVRIAPVTLDQLTQVKLKVDSILSKYPSVTVQPDTGTLMLKGILSAKAKSDLQAELSKQHLPELKDSIIVR